MDKRRLYQILSILLLPYRDKNFTNIQKDIIANTRMCFAQLKQRDKMSATSYRKAKKRYEESENELLCFLQKHTEWGIRRLDDFKLFLELFYPEKEVTRIFEKNEWIGQNIYKINQVYLDNIYKVARSLLTFRDGRVAIRTWINENDETDIFNYPNVFDKVQIWNLLGRMITTDVIVVAFFVEVDLCDTMYLEGQTGAIFLADKALEKILQKGLTETHLHFNAGAEFAYLWQKITDVRYWKLEDEEQYWKKWKKQHISYIIPVYRLLWGEYLEFYYEKKKFILFIKEEYSRIEGKLRQMFSCMINGKVDIYDSEWRKIQDYFVQKWKVEGKEEFLMSTIYCRYDKEKYFSEMLLLFKSLLYFRYYEYDDMELQMFMQYIRYKNLYYNEFVQNNQIEGLANFSLHFKDMSNKFRNEMEVQERYTAIFKSIMHNSYLKKLEIRISPDIKVYAEQKQYEMEMVRQEIKRMYLEKINIVLKTYKEYLCRVVSVDNNLIGEVIGENDILVKWAAPALGIVFHFAKKDYVDNKIADTCWVQKDEEIKSWSMHLRVWRKALVNNAVILEELRSQIPLLADYVVGIDVASQENQAEPWIFAPLYVGIRNRKTTKPILKNKYGEIKRINNIGFTYHVGEEYRHLLSGFRHIDEVIEHFHYKAGDRLGHAIALGTDVEHWIKENEVVVIPIMEHMENLIWLWGKMVYQDWHLEISMEALESKILMLAEEIYGDITGMMVSMLYDAYIEKFKLNYEKRFDKIRNMIMSSEEKGENGDNCGDTWNHFCKFYNIKEPYGIMWNVDKIFCTYFCPVFYQRFAKPVLVSVRSEEYHIFEKVQNLLIEKIERIGIYVETNPTSNLAIGDAADIYTHHLLHLNSKGLDDKMKNTHEVLVTVNSDDPIIFNTSSENELSYVYHALTYKGYKKESILEWIDKIRQRGMESSFVKQDKDPSQQIRELDELIRCIEEILKNISA